MQPECEGLFVPFGNDTTLDHRLISLENDLFELFCDAVGGLNFAEAMADDFTRTLNRYADEHWRAFNHISLDPDLLADSVEAWVHVCYHPPQSELAPLFEGVGPPPYRAVLTWNSTD